MRFPQSLVIAEYFNYDRFGEIVLALPLAASRGRSRGTAIDEPGAAGQRPRRSQQPAAGSRSTTRRAPRTRCSATRTAIRSRSTTASAAATPSQNTVGVLGFDFSLYRIFPTGPARLHGRQPAAAAPEPVGGTLRGRGDEHAQLLPHARLPDASDIRWTTSAAATQNLECRGADADQPTSSRASATSCWRRSPGSNARRHRPQRDREHARRRAARPEHRRRLTHLGPALRVHRHRRDRHRRDPGRPDLQAGEGDAGRERSSPRPRAVDPRFIDTKSRPALAQTFEVNATGARFTVVVNHLKSKGSACKTRRPRRRRRPGQLQRHARRAAARRSSTGSRPTRPAAATPTS